MFYILDFIVACGTGAFGSYIFIKRNFDSKIQAIETDVVSQIKEAASKLGINI